jgi:hypothetical protein
VLTFCEIRVEFCLDFDKLKRRASSDTNTSPIEKTNVYHWYPNSNDLNDAQNKMKLRYPITMIYLWHTTSMQNIFPKPQK